MFGIKFRISAGVAPALREIDIPLPDDERTSVFVEVFVGNEEEPQYSEMLRCSDRYAHVPLTGTGLKQIKVYFDGLLAQDLTQYLQFE